MSKKEKSDWEAASDERLMEMPSDAEIESIMDKISEIKEYTYTDIKEMSKEDLVKRLKEYEESFKDLVRRLDEEKDRYVPYFPPVETEEDDLMLPWDGSSMNTQPCAHDSCSQCHGTGRRADGSMCIHNLYCGCPKCSPRC